MAAGEDKLTCHFYWNMEPDNSKSTENVIEQINIHLNDQVDTMTIPALLFRAYLYMSAYSPSKNPDEASKSLQDAETEIEKLQDIDAKNGFNVVYYSLAAIILGKEMFDKGREDEYRLKVRTLQKELTPKSRAYIDVSRAFALSRLGPARLEECVEYFINAVDVSKDKVEHVEWRMYLGIMHGRVARTKEGIPSKETAYTRQERQIYERVLELDPNNATANLFLGQVLTHEGKKKEGHIFYEKALRLGSDNMRVLNWCARYFRQSFYWTKALECVNKGFELKHTNPDAMLHHQKALIYLRKYEGLLKNERQRDPKKLPGETKNPESLLPFALEAINNAIKLNTNSVWFGLDRALIYEMQGQNKCANTEYSRLLTLINSEKPQDNINIFLKFGSFLLRTSEQSELEAMLRLKQGIEIAVRDCIEVEEDGRRSFQSGIEKLVTDAIEKYEACLTKNDDYYTALKNLGWLVHAVDNMVTQYTKTSESALGFYEKAYDKVKKAGFKDESSVDDILEGLIDCHITKGQDDDFVKAEKYAVDLVNAERRRIKIADLKLAKGNQLAIKGSYQEARRTFLEAVEAGSVEACEKLLKSLDSPLVWGWDVESAWQFRADCAKLMHCINNKDGCLTIVQTMGALSLHHKCRKEGVESASSSAYENLSTRIKDKMKLGEPKFGDIRKAHFDLELEVLQHSGKEHIIKKCVDVMYLTRNKLDHVVQEFGANRYRLVKEKVKRNWKYPYIRQGVSEGSVEDELINRLEKQANWKDFKKNNPELFTFLLKVQPDTDPVNYSWISALADLVNRDKHKETLIDIDQEADIGKNPDGTVIKQKFNLIDLARVSSQGVEPICSKFYDSM